MAYRTECLAVPPEGRSAVRLEGPLGDHPVRPADLPLPAGVAGCQEAGAQRIPMARAARQYRLEEWPAVEARELR